MNISLNKKLLCATPLLVCAFVTQGFAQVDWTPTSKQGIIQITGSTPADYDIDIGRTKANAGLRIFNYEATGRSILFFGEDFGGRYGYLAYHNQSHNPGTSYNLIYQPRSTVLTGADINGLTLASQGELRFTSGGIQNGNLRMLLSPSGNLVVGNQNPDAKLSVSGTIYSNATRTDTKFNGWVGADKCNFVGSEAYWALRSATNNSYNLDVYNGGTPLTAMTVLQNGRVGIGTNEPDRALTVKGTIHTNEVLVDMNPTVVPDYVFEETYKLPSLREIETYVKINKHLPEVPSAKEMEVDGMNLKEMNLILLKKVEELTLYMIELKKENEAIKKELKKKK